jgi:hypothetical protein
MSAMTLDQAVEIVDAIVDLNTTGRPEVLLATSSSLLLHQAMASRSSSTVDLIVRIQEADPGKPPPPAIAHRAGSRLVAQESRVVGSYHVVWREYLHSLLSDSNKVHWSGKSDLRRWQFDDPVRFITDVLQGLNELHDLGIVHGDLRPEKIGRLSDGGYAIRDPGLTPSYRSLRYVAPEFVASPTREPTPSTDIHAFFSLALDALRPYRGDRTHPHLARLDAQFRWLKDYFSTRPTRPDAESLLALFSGIAEHSTSSLETRSARPFGRVSRSIGDLLARYPETALTLSSEQLFDVSRTEAFLSEVRPRASVRALSGPRGKRILPPKTSDGLLIDEFPEGIDTKWFDAIHRSHFGFPLDAEHRLRMQSGHRELDIEIVTAEYQIAVKLAEESRTQLLEENSFLSTAGVLRLLTGLTRDDLLVLRRWGRILALPDHSRFLYPTFQFNEGRVSPIVGDVHDQLAEDRLGLDASPWSELTYFCVKRELLAGRSLKDVLWLERDRAAVRRIVKYAQM